MLLVLGLAGAIWGIGHLMRVPRQGRGLLIGLWFVLVMIVQVVLPAGHPIRAATGHSPALWLLLAGMVALVVGYGAILRRLRARARDGSGVAPPPAPATLGPAELERYARHIILREIGGSGQTRLRRAKVLVIGAGGLGSPALMYLAAAGVGTLGIVDDDTVDRSNLQRQVIHDEDDIGVAKVVSARLRILDMNSHVQVRTYRRRLTQEIAAELFAEYDVILDGTDNFETRYLANRAAAERGIPLVSGALSQWEGQIGVFDPASGTPCYQCIFPEAPAPGLAPSCAEAGVLGPLPGVVGAMMAVETVKILTEAGTTLRGAMLIYDALHGETRRIALKRRPDCPVCGGAVG